MAEEKPLLARVEEAVDFIRERLDGREPKIGMTLGSGLNPFGESIEQPIAIPYADVPGMRVSTAWGHVGRFVCGYVEGKLVFAMQGRIHLYEGYTPLEVAFPIWVMAKLGVTTLITTNAAGGINESFEVGDFCIITDHINYSWQNPTSFPEAAELGARFFTMTDAYDPELREIAKRIGEEQGVPMQEGVYLGLLGCSFETPAEIRAFRMWGCDLVGMSTVNEVIAARQMGVRVLGISFVSNMAAGVGAKDGIGGASPDPDEVALEAKRAEENFSRLVTGIVKEL